MKSYILQVVHPDSGGFHPHIRGLAWTDYREFDSLEKAVVELREYKPSDKVRVVEYSRIFYR